MKTIMRLANTIIDDNIKLNRIKHLLVKQAFVKDITVNG